MTSNDATRFHEGMKRMALIFPNKALTQDVLNIYWSALQSYAIEQVEGAMQYIQNNKRESFFPAPGEIVDCIKSHFLIKPKAYTPDFDMSEPVNPCGAAYMVYCLHKGKEWDWTEYANFKLDFNNGRVLVTRTNETRGNGVLFSATKITWSKGE